MLGVDNSMEDRDRKIIDSAIKDLRPPVFPQNYILEYCDVLDEYGYLIGMYFITLEVQFYRRNINEKLRHIFGFF